MRCWSTQFFVICCIASAVLVEETTSTDEKQNNGIIQNIHGGLDVNITEAPYQVQLLLPNGILQCGGAIIDELVILTAAHCTQFTQIVAGTTYLNSSDDGKQRRNVKESIPHPKFHPIRNDYDFRLVFLDSPLEFGDNVKPVALPLQDESLLYGLKGTIAGWGITGDPNNFGLQNHLKFVEIPIENDTICLKRKYITKRMFCAGYPDGSKDACKADSGGGFVLHKRLVGIVSMGPPCNYNPYGRPGIYSRVSAVRDWIDEELAKHKILGIDPNVED